MCLLFTRITPLHNSSMPLPSLPSPPFTSPISFLFVTRWISLPFFCLRCSGWQKILARDHPKNIAHRNLLFWASNPYFFWMSKLKVPVIFFSRRRSSILYFIVVTFSRFTRKQVRKRKWWRSRRVTGLQDASAYKHPHRPWSQAWSLLVSSDQKSSKRWGGCVSHNL